jgi:hypothetical protein
MRILFVISVSRMARQAFSTPILRWGAVRLRAAVPVELLQRNVVAVFSINPGASMGYCGRYVVSADFRARRIFVQ